MVARSFQIYERVIAHKLGLHPKSVDALIAAAKRTGRTTVNDRQPFKPKPIGLYSIKLVELGLLDTEGYATPAGLNIVEQAKKEGW